jgi:hypothetical protein
MITIEDFSTTANLQTIKVWFGDGDHDYVNVDLEIKHDYVEVINIDMEIFGRYISPYLHLQIEKAVTDHVEQYFEVPEWEDDPDRVYERRNDK